MNGKNGEDFSAREREKPNNTNKECFRSGTETCQLSTAMFPHSSPKKKKKNIKHREAAKADPRKSRAGPVCHTQAQPHTPHTATGRKASSAFTGNRHGASEPKPTDHLCETGLSHLTPVSTAEGAHTHTGTWMFSPHVGSIATIRPDSLGALRKSDPQSPCIRSPDPLQ